MTAHSATTEDFTAIQDVMATERWARDAGQWELMARCFHPDSRVEISWISTDGPTFVDLSRQGFEAGARSAHVLGVPVVRVAGDRALADAGATITGPLMLHGAPALLTAQSRIVERLERIDGSWKIVDLTCIYEFDSLAPGRPGTVLHLDARLYDSFRPSYAALSYWVAQMRGADAVRQDLPGIDRPASVTAVYDQARAWLEERP